VFDFTLWPLLPMCKNTGPAKKLSTKNHNTYQLLYIYRVHLFNFALE
jgi:hypothetical protein